MAVTAAATVMLAGIVVINRDSSSGLGVSALPGATGQPAPTGPTGGSGGGSGGGPPFPLQPPDMPTGPPNGYNSGAYPAPDQGNGVSIYNSDAPESPASQGGNQQAPNNPQQVQPANGTQPPNYDAPLQTAAAQQPSAAPSSAPHSAAPQQPQSGQTQQQPSQRIEQPQQQTDNQQLNEKQQQCQAAMSALGNVVSTVPVAIGGGGRSIHFKLDPTPAPAPPPCPGGCPTTVQKSDGSTVLQMTPEQYQKAMDQAAEQGAKKALQTKDAQDKAFKPGEVAGKMAAGCFTGGAGVAVVGWVAGPIDIPATILGCAAGGLLAGAGAVIEWALK